MRKLTCFVILPSNRQNAGAVPVIKDERYGLVEKPTGCTATADPDCINFDDVYELIIAEAVKQVNDNHDDLEINCTRGVELRRPGDILPQLIEQICKAEITITDVTTQNPNVFLEFGLRLSVKDSLNIMICDDRVRLPFDVARLRCIYYSVSDMKRGKKAIEEIAENIESCLGQLLAGRDDDSGSFYHRFVDLHTGRLIQRERLGVLEASPKLMASLAGLVFKEKPDLVLKHKVLTFFDEVGKTLEKDPEGQLRAIEHYKIFSSIDGLSKERLEEVYLKLWQLCDADDDRKAEAEQYLEKLKRLEENQV